MWFIENHACLCGQRVEIFLRMVAVEIPHNDHKTLCPMQLYAYLHVYSLTNAHKVLCRPLTHTLVTPPMAGQTQGCSHSHVLLLKQTCCYYGRGWDSAWLAFYGDCVGWLLVYDDCLRLIVRLWWLCMVDC